MELKPLDYDRKPGRPKDSRLILIVTEGQREDGYFKFTKGLVSGNVVVELVPRDGGAVSPRYALSRLDVHLKRRKDKIGWDVEDGDQIWFVFDVDSVKDEVDRLIEDCQTQKNYYTAISNPCFEVWLHYHSVKEIQPDTCRNLKTQLDTLPGLGQYSAKKFAGHIQTAITNAKAADTNPNHSFPAPMQTKVYKLAESLLAILNR